MKRSEMIKILDSSLFKHMGHFGGAGVNRADLYKVLDDLIKAGMLPPKACIERSVRVGNEERIGYHNTHEWEDE